MWLLLRVLPAFRCFLVRVAHRGVGYRHLIGLIFTMVYASRVKKNPLLSRVHESDRFFREKQADVEQRPFTFGDWLVLIVLTAVMVCYLGRDR